MPGTPHQYLSYISRHAVAAICAMAFTLSLSAVAWHAGGQSQIDFPEINLTLTPAYQIGLRVFLCLAWPLGALSRGPLDQVDVKSEVPPPLFFSSAI